MRICRRRCPALPLVIRPLYVVDSRGVASVVRLPRRPDGPVRTPYPAVVDLETYAVEPRPDYPPEPVGVAVKLPGQLSQYYAFAHPGGGNNATREEAVAAICEAYACPDGVLFHHAKFDVDVIATHLGLQVPLWNMIHDTLFLLFLDDPHQRELGLKPAAKRLLGYDTEERDAVADWLVDHQPVEGVKISDKPNSENTFGKFIAYAPGDVVAPYACGDVDRTAELFAHLWPAIVGRDMLHAYERERKLMPILLDMERRGVRVDLARLKRDLDFYHDVAWGLDAWLCAKLNAPGINLGSGQELARALIGAGFATRESLGVTPKGAIATNKAALDEGVTDKTLSAALRYRSQLKTSLGTFMEPWHNVAERAGGFIYTEWHQTRGIEKNGTRTGRLSSTPNFQNIPKEFDQYFDGVEDDFLRDLPPLPLCRGYIIAYVGTVICGRDYQGQELRALAHFEDAGLKQLYDDDPWVDIHAHAQVDVNQRLNRDYKRRPIKNLGFSIIYGSGANAISSRLAIGFQEARSLKDAYLKTFPGLKNLYAITKQRAALNQPIRTWGGREYYCEPPSIINFRVVTWDYKLVNVLVQGSSADATKEAMIRWFYHPKRRRYWHLILQVHDEIVINVPISDIVPAMALLRACMESLEFDVPMLTEGAWSADNWAAMRAFDTKGVVIYKEDKQCLTRISRHGRQAGLRPMSNVRLRQSSST